MKILHITQDEAFSRLSTPYNPPILESRADEESFSKEWHCVWGGLRKLLESVGTIDAYGRGDFCMGEQMTTSRGIGFEVTSDDVDTESLSCRIHKWLNDANDDYEIYFSFFSGEDLKNCFVNKMTIMRDW